MGVRKVPSGRQRTKQGSADINILNHFVNLTVLRGALVGALCWVGFAAATSFATSLFSGHPKALWLINSSYNLVSFVVAGIILALWR